MSDTNTLVTLGAVVLGGSIATAAQFAGDWIRERRANKTRWYAQRHAAYSHYLTETLPALQWLEHAEEMLRGGHVVDEFDIVAWGEQMRYVVAELTLVGSGSVIYIASGLHKLVWGRGHFAQAVIEGQRTYAEMAEVTDALDVAAMPLWSQLVNAMREDLGSDGVGEVASTFTSLGARDVLEELEDEPK